MRLLNTSTYKVSGMGAVRADYAILSHRWLRNGEITYQELNSTNARGSNLDETQLESLNKTKEACAKAREQGLDWIWMDTCCIDKTNAVEYTRSINSMFEYYRKAKVCYAYLSDVDCSAPGWQKFRRKEQPDLESEWFERGWTLQELLAPEYMEFYDREWRLIGTKDKLAEDLHRVTHIERKYLINSRTIKEASVATRISWMAGRTTTQLEDIAYSMLGILNINMTAQYGEGAKAFMRLQETLIESPSSDESIFAWTIPTEGLTCYRALGELEKWAPENKIWGLLAPSPDCFKDSGDLVIVKGKGVPRVPGGYRWTPQGVQFLMPQKSGTEATNWLGLPRKEVSLALNCWRIVNGQPLTIVIHLLKRGDVYDRVQCHKLDPKKNAKPSTNSVLGIDQVIRRPLTIAQPELDPLDLVKPRRTG